MSSDYRLGAQVCQFNAVQLSDTQVTHFAMSQIDTLTFCAHAYEISDAVAFLLRNEIQIGPTNKSVIHAMNCFPREHHNV
jgi:hypothetical protein